MGETEQKERHGEKHRIRIDSIEEGLHERLQRELGFSDYYGKNLDALYDELSVYPDAVEFRLDIFLREESLAQLLLDAAEENANLSVCFQKQKEPFSVYSR